MPNKAAKQRKIRRITEDKRLESYGRTPAQIERNSARNERRKGKV